MGQTNSSSTEKPIKKHWKINIHLYGLLGSGKSTIIERIKQEMVVSCKTINVKGLNATMLQYKNTQLISMLGMSEKPNFKLRNVSTLDAIIYVFDLSVGDVTGEIYFELVRLISFHQNNCVPILIFANKIDLPLNISRDQVIEQLHLDSITNRKWYVQYICALTGDGISRGFEWLNDQLRPKTSDLLRDFKVAQHLDIFTLNRQKMAQRRYSSQSLKLKRNKSVK